MINSFITLAGPCIFLIQPQRGVEISLLLSKRGKFHLDDPLTSHPILFHGTSRNCFYDHPIMEQYFVAPKCITTCGEKQWQS